MVKVASNEVAAQQATKGITSIEEGVGAQAAVSQSNITGMTTGATVANQMVGNINQFMQAVKEQAAKFPTLAAAMSQRDEATRFQAGVEKI